MSRLIEDYLRNLFEEKKVPENQREQLWRYYYDKLSKGVDEGFSPQSSHYDKDLADALKLSIAEFSAFKETSFRKTIETLLVDENGSLRSWSEFKKEAYKVSGDYNHRWLETEYHQTIANAQMAEKWKGFEANADLFPNLKLVSVKDGRVRPEHQVLDGTIRPLNDPFWKTHTPPLDWGCRCDVIQTDEPPTEIKGGLQLKIEFENNPAISGKIFGGSAYMTSGGLNPEMIEKIGNWGARMYKKVKDEAVKLYEKTILSRERERQFKKAFNTEKGSVLKHLLYRKGEDHKAIMETAKVFAKNGSYIEILPEINRKGFEKFREIVFPNFNLNKNPDLRIDGVYYDVKRVSNFNEFTRNANRASKQNSIAILVFNDTLDERKMLQLKDRIYGKNNIDKNGKPNYDKEIFYVLNKGKLHKYNRD